MDRPDASDQDGSDTPRYRLAPEKGKPLVNRPQSSPDRPGRRRRYNRPGRVGLPLAVSLLLNAALLGGLLYLFFGRPATGPVGTSGRAPVPVAAVESIEALGRIQPAGGVVSVFGLPGERIAELKVNLGDPVTAGQELAVLSGAEERKRSLAALDAQIAEAKALQTAIQTAQAARIADLKVETAQAIRKAQGEIQALDARIAGLKAQAEQARAERQRLAEVERGGVAVSEQERAQADLLVTQAEQGLAAAAAQRSAAVEQVRTAPEAEGSKGAAITAEARRALAQVPLASLEASRAVAEQKLRDAAVRAPVAGRVVKLLTHTGDTLTQQPVLQIAATEAMAVLAEVYESDVARLREWLAKAPGNRIAVEVDARVIGGEAKLTGTTTAAQIAPMIARNTVFALGPREDADRRVVEVEVHLDPAASKTVADFIGLQVRTRFLAPK
jgi:HlyD family secretion protein